MDNSLQRNAGGKSKKFRPLVNGGGLGNLAIYTTTAGSGSFTAPGSKQSGELEHG